MTLSLTRRHTLGLIAAAAATALARPAGAFSGKTFRIRTISTGAVMRGAADTGALEQAAVFLRQGRDWLGEKGFSVQTTRVGTQPMQDYLDWRSADSLTRIRELDALAQELGVILSLGPVNNPQQGSDEFVEWVIALISSTSRCSCSLTLTADKGGHPQPGLNTLAAKIIAGIAGRTKGGEGNFRFVATANCPPGTPFFPAGWFENEAFSLGLETPDLLLSALGKDDRGSSAELRLAQTMNRALQPLAEQARLFSKLTGRPYLGIDSSPAPNLDVSIGRVIETISGRPFGAPGTLAACAIITRVLRGLELETCGYSGLMLPVLEDTVLARRAMEGRYTVKDLLLYSSVCGTGLDVVPLPGNTPVDVLAAHIGDVAALSYRYSKALSARLFPVPGKKAGEKVHFDNPYLTDCIVMQAA